jgi:hypothetical protein
LVACPRVPFTQKKKQEISQAEATPKRWKDLAHWVAGKHGRVRTVPMPTWVKVAVGGWTVAANVADGSVFQPVTRTGQVQGAALSEKVVWQLLQGYPAAVGGCATRTDSSRNIVWKPVEPERATDNTK